MIAGGLLKHLNPFSRAASRDAAPLIAAQAPGEDAEIALAIRTVYEPGLPGARAAWTANTSAGPLPDDLFLLGILLEILEGRTPALEGALASARVHLFRHFLKSDNLSFGDARQRLQRVEASRKSDNAIVRDTIKMGRRAAQSLSGGMSATRPLPIATPLLTRGQWVEVRPAAEIAATLDADGKLDGLPFMPEMAAYVGRRVRVYRRAEKTCVEGAGLRAMSDTVFLTDVRCDGGAHDGCQRGCLIFWKEAWLKPIDETAPASPSSVAMEIPTFATRRGERYVCQSTELRAATQTLSKLNFALYLRELRVGELTIGRLLRIAGRVVLNRLRAVVGMTPIGAVLGTRTGHGRGDLDLREGDWVVVKSPEDIRATVGPAGRNRGLYFEPDMLTYVGQRHQVERRIDRIISEETGAMIHMSNTVALRGVACEGVCAKNCPRKNHHYWREAWLRRAPERQYATTLARTPRATGREMPVGSR